MLTANINTRHVSQPLELLMHRNGSCGIQDRFKWKIVKKIKWIKQTGQTKLLLTIGSAVFIQQNRIRVHINCMSVHRTVKTTICNEYDR